MNPQLKIKNFFRHKYSPHRPPLRGEIWIEPLVLESIGLANNAVGIAHFAAQIKADFCFFSCGGSQPVKNSKPDMKEAVEAARRLSLVCGAVIDGPWQRLTYHKDLMLLLQKIISDPHELQELLSVQVELAKTEMAAWAEAGIDLLLVADDIAYNNGLYFSPTHFEQLLKPCYKTLFGPFKSKNFLPVGFHCDGNLSLVLPDLIDLGFVYFNLEPEAVNLEDILGNYGRCMFAMSGIKADWLYGENAAGKATTDFPGNLPDLLKHGNLLLSSTCGLYQPSSVAALRSIYQWLDNYYKTPDH